jgi:hypothetical protein
MKSKVVAAATAVMLAGVLGHSYAADLISVLSAGTVYTIVDTVTLKRAGRNPVSYYTNGFFADVDDVDTFNFGAQIWPGEYIKVSYTLGFTRMAPYTISGPVEDQWYSFPTAGLFPDGPKIKFRFLTGVAETDASIPVAGMTARPNPFRDRTTVRFQVDQPSQCRVDVVDRSGRVRTTLLSGRLGAGAHAVEWNRLDNRSRRVPAGVYFCRLVQGTRVSLTKLVLTD